MGIIKNTETRYSSKEKFLEEAKVVSDILNELNIPFDYIEPGVSLSSVCYISLYPEQDISAVTYLIILMGGEFKKGAFNACWFSLSKELALC